MVYVAIADKAAADSNIDLLERLATDSLINKRATDAGKFIRAFGELDKNSPIRIIQKIKNIRSNAAGKANKSNKTETQLKEVERKLIQTELDSLIKETPTEKRKYGQKNKRVTIERRNEILAEIAKENEEIRKQSGNNRSKGALYIPSAKDFSRALELGIFHIEAIGNEFKDWSKAMADDLGGWVKPHLEDLWSSVTLQIADDDIELAKQRIKKVYESDNDTTKLHNFVVIIAKAYVLKGTRNRDILVDNVKTELDSLGIKLSPEKVAKVIVNYGKSNKLSQEEVDVVYDDLKRQLLQVVKLRELKAGNILEKTGPQRRPPSDEARNLIKQVNEAKKKANYTTIDPETQIKSALETVKTRLRNAKTDLDNQINSGKRIVKSKSDSPSDEEVKLLIEQRNELQEIYDEIFSKDDSEVKKISRAISALTRKRTQLSLKILTNDISKKKTSKTLQTAEIKSLKERVAELTSQLNDIQDNIDPNIDYRRQLEGQLKQYEAIIESGDFAPRQAKDRVIDPKTQELINKKEELSRTVRTARLLSDEDGFVSQDEIVTVINLSKKISDTKQIMDTSKDRRGVNDKPTDVEMDYGFALVALEKFVEDVQYQAAKKSVGERLKSWLDMKQLLSDLAGTAKSIRASMDNSFIGRQGIRLFYMGVAGDVKAGKIWLETFFKSFSVIFNSLRGKPVMDYLRAEILSDPDYELMRRGKVATATVEEEFPIHWPSKIPYIGRVFKASEEAFTASAYFMRYKTAKMYFNIAKNTGIDLKDDIQVQSIGRLVNSLTARGYTGDKGSAPGFINNVIWSPKLIKSHLDVLLIQPLSFGRKNFSAFAQRQAAKNLLRIILGQAIIMAIANEIWPDSVELDPRSSDFGKLRIGKTRYDISGGTASLIVLAARVVPALWGEAATKTTSGKVIKLNLDKFGSKTGTDVIEDFIEGKLSPIASTFKDIINNKQFNGEPVTPYSVLESLIVPLPIANAIDEFNKLDDQTQAQFIAGRILDVLGTGVNTYSDKKSTGKIKRYF